MYGLYEFTNDIIEVGRLNLIEGEYDPELDKEYLVWWPQNGKKTAWTAKVLSTGGKLARLESSSSTDIIQRYKDLQKAQEVNEQSYLRTLEERLAALERENHSLRNALSIIEGMLI
ncbi:hypothetical protein CgunFtcFv8_026326 [Champsocephalus gunnari]|uniref:Uncharacterized protein n=1 Tax=Champsocephalus gunnari TaxID=52237 RepID=A0AAN8H3K3_CHAGU|nr:hypothetical protein CgunFtcFv8_026326 [Champsocephalus gunnari]